MSLCIDNALELAVASNLNEDTQRMRQEEVRNMPASGKRIFSQALLALAQRYPNGSYSLLNSRATRKGFKYLGAGVEFSVYRNIADGNVVKISRRSALMDVDELGMLEAEKRAAYKCLDAYLPGFVLEQAVEIKPHLLSRKYDVLQLTQPYVEFDPYDNPFLSNEPTIDVEALSRVTRKIPGVEVAYQELIDGSRSMITDTQLVPDTNGVNNIVAQPNGSLILLDTTPVDTTSPWGQAIVLDQLAALEQGLREVA